MPSTNSRRDVLYLCGTAFTLGTAGCLGESSSRSGAGDSPNGNGSHGTTAANGTTASNGTATETQSTTSERTTVAASEVSDLEAKERALAAEKAFLTERLRNASCLTDWGTYPTTAEKRATVTKRTAEGVYVDVTHPYSYSTERTEADAASNAVYVVSVDSVRRVRGERVSIPC